MFVEELHDLSLDLWVSRYVGSDPSLDDRLGILCRENTCGDLGVNIRPTRFRTLPKLPGLALLTEK